MEHNQRLSVGVLIVHVVSLIVLNMALMAVFNFLTIDSWASLNSRAGALLLGFFIPMFIVYRTRHMPPRERLLKFGLGFMVDIILFVVIAGFPEGITSGLIPSLLIALGTLYYGSRFVSAAE